MTSLGEQAEHRPPGSFVGRERELTELRAALDDANAGRGTQVCIQPLHPDNETHPNLKAVEAFARLNKPLRIDPREAAGVTER